VDRLLAGERVPVIVELLIYFVTECFCLSLALLAGSTLLSSFLRRRHEGVQEGAVLLATTTHPVYSSAMTQRRKAGHEGGYRGVMEESPYD
jgi:hypothetical protein